MCKLVDLDASSAADPDVARYERDQAPHLAPLANYTRLSDLPDLRGCSRLLKAALKASWALKPNPKIANAKKRSQKFAAQRIEAVAAGVSVELREQLAAFRQHMRRLSPFET